MSKVYVEMDETEYLHYMQIYKDEMEKALSVLIKEYKSSSIPLIDGKLVSRVGKYKITIEEWKNESNT